MALASAAAAAALVAAAGVVQSRLGIAAGSGSRRAFFGGRVEWGAFDECAQEAGLHELRLPRPDQWVVAGAVLLLLLLGLLRGGAPAQRAALGASLVVLVTLVTAGAHRAVIHCANLAVEGLPASEVVAELRAGLRFAARSTAASLLLWAVIVLGELDEEDESGGGAAAADAEQAKDAQAAGKRASLRAAAGRSCAAALGAVAVLCMVVRCAKSWRSAVLEGLSEERASGIFLTAEERSWSDYSVGPTLSVAAEAQGLNGHATEQAEGAELWQLWGSGWLGRLAVEARAGRQQVDCGDLLLDIIARIGRLPAALREWLGDDGAPRSIHPNMNWLRGSRWSWVDGGGVNGTVDDGSTVHYAILGDGGRLFTSTERLNSSGAMRHARQLEGALLRRSLEQQGLGALRRRAIELGLEETRLAQALDSSEPRRALIALLLHDASVHPTEPADSGVESEATGAAAALAARDRCVPCAAEPSASADCGRWSANASHVFVVWRACGMHVLRPTDTSITPTTSLAGRRIAASGLDGPEVVAVGGTRSYQGAPRWRRAAG